MYPQKSAEIDVAIKYEVLNVLTTSATMIAFGLHTRENQGRNVVGISTMSPCLAL